MSVAKYNFKRGDIILLLSQWFLIRRRKKQCRFVSRTGGGRQRNIKQGGVGKCRLCDAAISPGDLYLGHPNGDANVNLAFRDDYANPNFGYVGVCIGCGIANGAEVCDDGEERVMCEIRECENAQAAV